mmetsp:Transcript_53345/g.155448  ORF Transcript_53345/g.155448 Transcript_53345/m.155448 type:complete len:316 (-) Transcript_53345:468-1415(-)
MTWPSEMDLSSSISQFGTPGTSAAGSVGLASSPSPMRSPLAAASSLIFCLSLSLVSSLIRGIFSISSNFCSNAFCFRWSRPPGCSHTHGSKETEPALSEFAARETSANQNLRRSAIDSRRTVPSSSVQSSSLGSTMMPLARRSSPAAPAKMFHTRCIGSRSITTNASPSLSPICSAKDIAPFIAITAAPGSEEVGTTMTHSSQQPRSSRRPRMASASSRLRQTQTQSSGPGLAPGPPRTAMRSAQRCSRSFTASVPWKSMVWPRPIGTEKSIPWTPVKRDRYCFVLSCMVLNPAKINLESAGTGGTGRPSRGSPL